MYQRNNDLTPNEIRNILYSTSTDINVTGVDTFTGSGIIRSDLAVKYATDLIPPVLIDEQFIPNYSDPVSFTINLRFFETSGLIECNYYYQTTIHNWTEKKNCANFENR